MESDLGIVAPSLEKEASSGDSPMKLPLKLLMDPPPTQQSPSPQEQEAQHLVIPLEGEQTRKKQQTAPTAEEKKCDYNNDSIWTNWAARAFEVLKRIEDEEIREGVAQRARKQPHHFMWL